MTRAFSYSIRDRSQAQQDGSVPHLKCSGGFPQTQAFERLERLPAADGKLSNVVSHSDGSRGSLPSVLLPLALTAADDNPVSSTASRRLTRMGRDLESNCSLNYAERWCRSVAEEVKIQLAKYRIC